MANNASAENLSLKSGGKKPPFHSFNRREIGAAGETMAAEYLEKKGFTLLERNFNTRRGEIDLILSKDQVIHFVEVKYRKDLSWGHPAEAITPEKLRRIQRTADFYLYQRGLSGVQWQIDVIGIVGEKIQWIPAVSLM